MVTVVANQKGGAGKTTTAIALAAGLTAQKRKVLLIDMDAQGNATEAVTGSSTAESDGVTIYHVLTKTAKAADAIQNAGRFGHIIPADSDLSLAENAINDIGKHFRLKKALEPILKTYDHIIIDTPPNLGVLTANALTAATGCVIPVGADKFGVRGIISLWETIGAIREHTNPELKVHGILLTRHDPRRLLLREYAEAAAELAKRMKTQLYKTVIRDCTAIREAQAQAQTIFEYAPKCTAAEDYAAFVQEFTKAGGKKSK